MCDVAVDITGAVLLGRSVVADGSTRDVLTNGELMRAHRLELPFGFDPYARGSGRERLS